MSKSLGKIAKGATIAFSGMLTFTFFEFVTRIIIARYAAPHEYGVFSIGFALLNIFVMVSCLGLQGGITRCIAYFRGKGENEKVAGIVYSSLQLSAAAGLFFFLVLFFSSEYLKEIFHLEQSAVLKLFAIAIPFLTVVEILSYIFIGFDRIKEKVFFRDILMYLLRFSCIAFAIIIGFDFHGMMYAYLLPTVIVAIAFTGYTAKNLAIKLKVNAAIRKKLLYFSIPLLASSISILVMQRIDTLMLGYFKTADAVGLYNSAYPIAQLIPIFLSSIILIYIPISSQLYSKNRIDEMRRNYAVLTKWTLASTLPFFLVIFLFPDAVVVSIFGPFYAQAGDALRILSIGGFIQVFFGPNAATLVIIGKTKLNMVDDIIGAVMNVILNLLLIPVMGILGAAIASTAAFSTVAVLKSAQIYWMHRLHPFTWNYLKPVVVSGVIVTAIFLFFGPVHFVWMLAVILFVFIAVYGMSLVVTRSLDEEDVMILLEIEKVISLDASGMKRLLRKFK
jgi:O-antigen/teichoic acid export membrane protein